MNGYSSMSLSPSSDAIISGSFGVVDYAENLLNNYFGVFSDVMNTVAKDEQEHLRETAKTSSTGWADIANSLTVTYNDTKGAFVYGVAGNGETQSRAVALEYGDPDTAPTPFIRSAVLQNQHDLEKEINDKLKQKMMEKFNG